MDLSQMSDAELEAIASGQAPSQQAPDLSHMSDEELQKIAGNGQAPQILQEQHPEFSLMDRLAVKNFANNNEASVNYLQKQHPDLEVKVDDFSGQILARKRDGSEKAYRVLDPDQGFLGSFTHPLEALKDIGDSAYDLGSGAVEGLAAAGAGLAASPTGLGALAASAAAGGGTGAALEGLRQLAGKSLGVNQGFDPGNIGAAGIAGAVSPLLFGTGASTKEIGEQALKNLASGSLKGSAEDAAAATLKSQKGLLTRGIGTLAPKIGGIASGVPEDVIRHMKANPDLIDKVDSQGLLQHIDDLTSDITDTGLQKKRQLGQKVANAFAETRNLADELKGLPPDLEMDYRPVSEILDSVQVNVDKVRQPFDELLERLTDNAARNPTQANQDKVDYVKNLVQEHFYKKVPGEDGEISYQPISRLDGESAWNLKQDLGNIAELHKVRPGTGSTLPKGAEKVDKEVIGAARKSTENARDEMLRVAGLVNPDGAKTLDNAFKTYSNLSTQMKFLDQFTSDPEKSYRNLNNLLNDARRVKKQRVQGLDKELADKTLNAAKDLAAYKAFTSSWLPISSQGVTSTLRGIPAAAALGSLGYVAGAKSGIGQGGAGVGLSAGLLLGALAGGPKALKAYMKLGRGVGGIGNMIQDTGLHISPQVLPWLYMKDRQNP